MRPIGIDLFAGAGGLSLGFEQAGFDIAASVEIDPIHCAVHAFNFPRCEVIPKSITELDGAEIRRLAKIGRRHIDVVFGGPPCQGFSLIGYRALDDPRNGLVKHFLRIVAELRPSYFVFENVKGLTVGRHRLFLEELIREFESIGYEVVSPWKVLNAADYGVPQRRERLFLLGVRKGLDSPEYPAPSSAPADSKKLGILRKGPSCKDALDDLPDAELFEELLNSDEVLIRTWKKPSVYGRQMRCIGEAGWGFGYRRKWNPKLLTSSLRTDHSEISRRRFAVTGQGEVEPISRFYKLHEGGISNTLRAGTDSARGAFTSPRPIHYSLARCITVREMARLHGFPDWFRFHETKWHGARQVGNAVPPPLARAVATEIIRVMKHAPELSGEVLSLGDERLLRMDMSAAADYFGITVPIARRNLKSGAKKRKQDEIETERSVDLPFLERTPARI
jgi:DNA (cytosine-5)-methyltransferase 1